MTHFVKFIYGLFALLILAACNQGGKVASSVNMKSIADSMAYSIGVSQGTGLRTQLETEGLDTLDKALLMKGILDGMYDEAVLTKEEVNACFQAFQKHHMAQMAEVNEAKATENKIKGDEFLAENKQKEGVITTESGLQYKIIEEGSGTPPGKTDTVKVHYTGRLIDGTVFDSSVQRGEPIEFPVNGVIQGWTEALQMMKPGAKWELYIPSELGYGIAGAGQDIGPNSTLIFEVELLDVKRAKEQ
ncbi:MAG: FKBP-type peptidyl-prolyl cis-trans isomerase [Bacteroidetes bacterium]|nr:MAG: FKBP-type peptidyl-prolyl cis-trans isomerase [Bacteroidota bacterium]